MVVLTTPPPHYFPPVALGRRCPHCREATHRVFRPPVIVAVLIFPVRSRASYRGCYRCGWHGVAWHARS